MPAKSRPPRGRQVAETPRQARRRNQQEALRRQRQYDRAVRRRDYRRATHAGLALAYATSHEAMTLTLTERNPVRRVMRDRRPHARRSHRRATRRGPPDDDSDPAGDHATTAREAVVL